MLDCRLLGPLLCLTLACDPKDTTWTEAEPEADADVDADTDADADADPDTDAGLPDLRQGLDEDWCDEDSEYSDLVGATSYFYGVFSTDGEGGWSGQERWILFATVEYEDAGGSDCEVVWTMSGIEADTDACSSCEFAIQLDANVDVSETTCPAGLYEGDESFTTTYGIDDAGDGTAATYYTGSGNRLGSGHISTDSVNYLSDRSCVWF